MMYRSIVACVLLLAACTTRQNPDTERAAIMKADSAWLAAGASRNVDSAVGFWTEDGRVISPGEPPVVGQEAIRKMLTDAFATPNFSVTWNTTDVVVSRGGDMAYSLGTNQFTMPNASGGVDTLRGQGVVVWVKSSDGRWRSAVDAWTPQPAQP